MFMFSNVTFFQFYNFFLINNERTEAKIYIKKAPRYHNL